MQASFFLRLLVSSALIAPTLACDPANGVAHRPATHDEDPAPRIPSTPEQEEDGAPEGTSVQSWGIGADWYIYGAGHSVRPKDRSWLIVRPDQTATHVRIEGYYSDKGISSTPSMTLTPWEDGVWLEGQHWLSPIVIREEFQCLDLSELSENRCDAAYDITWRTDHRALPVTGFSISNPALYAETGQGQKVYELPSEKLPDTLDDALLHGTRVLSVLDDDAKPLLHPRFFEHGYSVLQLSADMSFAEWTLLREEEEITIQSRCVQVNQTPEATDSFTESPQSLSLTAPPEGHWTYVDLCSETGPFVHAEASTLKAGGWPSNAQFDLALQTVNGTLHIWPAPEGVFTPQRSPAFEEKRVPNIYWED